MSSEIWDVVIIGAGPAGAAAALSLAPHVRVCMVERRAEIAPRIGESLVPAARRLLQDMGILDAFLAQEHALNFGNRAWWGLRPDPSQPHESDFLRDPDGPGWHLDRVRFETLLRQQALTRGAELITPAKLQSLQFDAGQWQVDIEGEGGQSQTLTSRLVLDASGRNAVVARQLGAQRQHLDQLVCGWLYGTVAREDARSAGFSLIESCADGWWYCAPLPGQRRVLAFHSDADLAAAAWLKDPRQIWYQVQYTLGLAKLLQHCEFRPGFENPTSADATNNSLGSTSGYTAAHSAVISPCAGPGWFALGDAAISFDPLSSQGLFKALYSAWLGASCARQYLSGDNQAIARYQLAMARIFHAYRQHLHYWYGSENRWSDAPFWARRQRVEQAINT